MRQYGRPSANRGTRRREAVVLAFTAIFAFGYVFTQTLIATHPNMLVIR